MRSGFAFVIALCAGVVVLGSSAGAQTSEQAAAIVFFPYVVDDPARGLDTRLQLSDVDPNSAVGTHCFYFDANNHCTSDGAVCASAADCSAGASCVPGFLEVDFNVFLTRGQPLSWRASQGLQPGDLPCRFPGCVGGDTNLGTSVPPTPEEPFVGSMICIAMGSAVDQSVPVERNVLVGSVSIERFQDAPRRLDVAEYAAVGLRAITGANNTDNVLILGGAQAEYEGCANSLTLNHLFDGAPDPIATGRQVFTTLVLLPCTLDTLRQTFPSQPEIDYVFFNEFGERFTAIENPEGVLLVRRLSALPSQFFTFANAGTLTGQTQISTPSVGFVAVAVEEHVDPQDPSRFNWAASNLHRRGGRQAADTFVLP
jgi:hypothetical protein